MDSNLQSDKKCDICKDKPCEGHTIYLDGVETKIGKMIKGDYGINSSSPNSNWKENGLLGYHESMETTTGRNNIKLGDSKGIEEIKFEELEDGIPGKVIESTYTGTFTWNSKGWEGRFDLEFGGNSSFYKEQAFKYGTSICNLELNKRVKSFISSLLSEEIRKERNRLIQELEDKRDEIYGSNSTYEVATKDSLNTAIEVIKNHHE